MIRRPDKPQHLVQQEESVTVHVAGRAEEDVPQHWYTAD